MKTFTLPLIVTIHTQIEIEADNIDEAHEKLIDMGKFEVYEKSGLRLPNDSSSNFEVDWEAFEPPEEDLSEKCREIYEEAHDGQAAVERFIRENYPEIPWLPCAPCEDETPSHEGACLVCGTTN